VRQISPFGRRGTRAKFGVVRADAAAVTMDGDQECGTAPREIMRESTARMAGETDEGGAPLCDGPRPLGDQAIG